MIEPVLVKRYVYDMHEVVKSINRVGEFLPRDPIAKAWIVEHLRAYHYLDVDDLSYRVNTSRVDERCGRLAQVLTHSLYKLFHPMSLRADDAVFTDIQFQHEMLSVSIYDAL